MKLYVNVSKTCEEFEYLTDLDGSSDRILLPDGTTLDDLKAEQNQIKQSKPTTVCDPDTPFTNNGKVCFEC